MRSHFITSLAPGRAKPGKTPSGSGSPYSANRR
jgi:hypothetical protein